MKIGNKMIVRDLADSYSRILKEENALYRNLMVDAATPVFLLKKDEKCQNGN